MEIKITKREYDLDGFKTYEYLTLATPESLEALRIYADDHRLRVGDTVRIRNDHIDRRGETIRLSPKVLAALNG